MFRIFEADTDKVVTAAVQNAMEVFIKLQSTKTPKS